MTVFGLIWNINVMHWRSWDDCIGGLLHLGPSGITFRTLLHLGQLLHLSLQQTHTALLCSKLLQANTCFGSVCYQIDIDMEVWSPADNMFHPCCLNQLFMLLSKKRSSICSMSYQKQMTVYNLSKNLTHTHGHVIISFTINNFSIDLEDNSNFVCIWLRHILYITNDS